MSTVDVLRQYAEEALRQAVQSKNEEEQLALIELVRTWTQAGSNERESDGSQLQSARAQGSLGRERGTSERKRTPRTQSPPKHGKALAPAKAWGRGMEAPPRNGSEPAPAEAGVAAGRGMKISINELGGVEEVAKVPELRAAVIVPAAKEKTPDTPGNATMVTKPRRRVRPSEGLAGAI